MPLMAIEEYGQRAEECDRLANTVTSPHVRETMLYMALLWRALAEEQEAKNGRARPPKGTRPQRLSE